jgi:hypothetical protein
VVQLVNRPLEMSLMQAFLSNAYAPRVLLLFTKLPL